MTDDEILLSELPEQFYERMRKERADAISRSARSEEDIAKFDEAWRFMADLGMCDGEGGAEYRRVFSKWLAKKLADDDGEGEATDFIRNESAGDE